MQQQLNLQLSPKDAANSAVITEHIAQTFGKQKNQITGFQLLKKSIDARKRKVLINLKVLAFIDEPFQPFSLPEFHFNEIGRAHV